MHGRKGKAERERDSFKREKSVQTPFKREISFVEPRLTSLVLASPRVGIVSPSSSIEACSEAWPASRFRLSLSF
jgi:hypothetical protein